MEIVITIVGKLRIFQIVNIVKYNYVQFILYLDNLCLNIL